MSMIEDKIRRRLAKVLDLSDDGDIPDIELMLHAAIRIERLQWELKRNAS